MGWLMLIVVFGFIALGFFILSQVSIWTKNPRIGLVFAVLELISASISSLAWMWALRVSGKGDWFLLGIFRYTPISLIFWSMFVVGILCVALSIWGIRRKNEPTVSDEA